MRIRKNSSREAFTLVEIMVVLGIAGVIIAAGIAPLMYTIRLLAETRNNFFAANRERLVVSRLFQETREITSNNASTPVKILHQDKLGSNGNDILLLWTTTPSYAGMPVGSVVYGIFQESVLKTDMPKGLYRWVLSGDIQPDTFVLDDLESENARLLLPNVEGIRFSALVDSEWVDDYSGNLPQALKITLEYNKKEEKTYESWLPKF